MGQAILAAGIALTLVHSWYPPECCGKDRGGEDCKPVACDELVETGKGIVYKNYTFTGHQIRPSQDAKCHVCITENAYGVFGWCVFVVPSS